MRSIRKCDVHKSSKGVMTPDFSLYDEEPCVSDQIFGIVSGANKEIQRGCYAYSKP